MCAKDERDYILEWLEYYILQGVDHFYIYNSNGTDDLVMCAKDERDYILEWLEYYILQGVDHFYIYNSNGTDDTKQLIQPYIEKGVVTYEDFLEIDIQIKIYNDAIDKYKQNTFNKYNPTAHILRCNHYVIKSKEEYLRQL